MPATSLKNQILEKSFLPFAPLTSVYQQKNRNKTTETFLILKLFTFIFKNHFISFYVVRIRDLNKPTLIMEVWLLPQKDITSIERGQK
jgi:hypothetical protein